ncbi:MAG: autotransporter outer membrane beta-barrel domain-containing protein, partial [Gammaproteobacteria bacterium]
DIALNIAGNTLQSTIKRNPYQSLASSSNQKALGTSLQNNLSTATGDLQNVMLQLDRLMTKGEFRAALDELSPEPFAALPQVIFTESQLYAGTIARHLRGIQLSQTQADHLQQLLPTLTSSGNAVNASSAISHAASVDKGFGAFSSYGWQAYLQPYGIFSRLDSNSEFTGFNANTGGFAAGVDRRVNDSTIVGANLGWAYTDVAWHRAGTQAYIQTGRLSGYWGYQKDQWNLNGIVSYGYHHYDADRRIQFGSINRIAQSSHDGHELSFYLNSAYNFQYRNLIFGPVASLQYTGLFDDSYNESGAAAAGFHFNGNDTHSLRSTLGLFGAVELDLGGTTIIPAVQLGWAHEMLNNQYTFNTQLQNATGGAFTVKGRDLGNDSAYIAAGFTVSLNRNTMLRLAYNADIGRTNYNNHMTNLMLIMHF